MEDGEFDSKLISAAFDLIAERGWRRLSVAQAALRASLPLAEARRRFPSRLTILVRFGRRTDQAALATSPDTVETPAATVRDALFDSLMRRIDALQAERAGVIALLRELPRDPPLAAYLAATTLASMGWLLEASGVETSGFTGALRQKGLLAVWLVAVRTWTRDESDDLAPTMAALDRALDRAGRFGATQPLATAAEPPIPEATAFMPPDPPASPV